MKREVKASEFKATCLRLMDEVAESGETIVITKNGRPISQLGPYRSAPKTLFGLHKDSLEILGDVVAPLDEIEWEAAR